MTYSNITTFCSFRISILLIVFGALVSAHSYARLPNPKERINFWQENYTSWTENDDKRVRTAHQIFAQVLKAAGQRRGVEPRLHIIKEDPHNLSLPISIPDGWIILSKSVIDICFQQKNDAKARLAFVLAHEIAHQLEDDFWHMKFFQALDSAQIKEKKNKQLFKQVRSIAQQSNKILAKELRADELGIIYTTIAGYNSRAVISGKTGDSFFSDWSKSRHPLRYTGTNIAKTHPSINQRTTAVKVRLQQISEHSDLFRLGLWFYYSGDYKNAIQSFDEFRRHFPGRAVHHNLAASYHRQAMRFYNATINKPQQLQFQLAMTIDPESRASNATIRNIAGSKKQFAESMNKAIKYYKLALEQDPAYIQSNINLASAYFHTGQPYKTIATSLDGLKTTPNNHLLLNNLAVALYETGNLARARKTLDKAMRIKPDFLAALYNIGNIEFREGNNEVANTYWQKYLDNSSETLWARYLIERSGLSLNYRSVPSPKNTREHIVNLQVGTYINELPQSWQQANSRKLNISKSPYHVTDYKNDVTTVAESDEIRLIIANSRFKGKTQQGISIGNTKTNVFNKYGYPAYSYMATSGQIIAYPEHGISFYIEDDKVSSWLLYWE